MDVFSEPVSLKNMGDYPDMALAWRLQELIPVDGFSYNAIGSYLHTVAARYGGNPTSAMRTIQHEKKRPGENIVPTTTIGDRFVGTAWVEETHLYIRRPAGHRVKWHAPWREKRPVLYTIR